jgi:acetyl-CoA acyltransferase
VQTQETTFAADERLRRGATAEKLARLKPSFREDGVIHAGNSSQISDGAAALLIMTREKAAELGLTPIVRFHTGAVSGADPVTMLVGPIPATQKLLKRAGVPVEEIGVAGHLHAHASRRPGATSDYGSDPTC